MKRNLALITLFVLCLAAITLPPALAQEEGLKPADDASKFIRTWASGPSRSITSLS